MSDRPRVRGDCSEHARPCLFVSCRYNLFLDVQSTGAVKLAGAASAPDEMDPEWSCALDVADRGPHEGSAIAKVLGVTDERVRQIFQGSLAKLKGVPGLSTLNAEVEPARASFAERVDLMSTSSRAPATARKGADSWRDVSGTNRGIEEARERAEADAWADRVVRWLSAGVPMRKAWMLASSTVAGDDEPKEERPMDNGVAIATEHNGTTPPRTAPRRLPALERDTVPAPKDETAVLVDELERARARLSARRDTLQRELALADRALATPTEPRTAAGGTHIKGLAKAAPQLRTKSHSARVLDFLAAHPRSSTGAVASALALDKRRTAQVLCSLKQRGVAKARGPKNAMMWSAA